MAKISDIKYSCFPLFLYSELSQNNSAQDSIDQVIQNMNDAVTNDQMGQENLHHNHGSKYSDYTEKLQSLYPECKFLRLQS